MAGYKVQMEMGTRPYIFATANERAAAKPATQPTACGTPQLPPSALASRRPHGDALDSHTATRRTHHTNRLASVSVSLAS